MPQETDGPVGALNIAKSFLDLDAKNRVDFYVDEVSFGAIEAVVSGFAAIDAARFRQVFVRRSGEISGAELAQLRSAAADYDAIVTIERAGRAADGHYKTMRGRVMDALLSPLDAVAEHRSAKCKVISIGDGGNEFGMGNVYAQIVGSDFPFYRPLSGAHSDTGNAEIACVQQCDFLLVCSVSNWGAYAIAGALCAATRTAENEIDTRFFLTDEQEWQLINQMVALGLRDGVTLENKPMVDGFPFEFSLQKKHAIQALLRKFLASPP